VYCKKTELLFEIQDKREVMIKTAKERGTIDEETIRLSQELDKLIYEYQLVFRYESEKRKQIKRQYKNTRIFWSNANRYKRKNYSEVVYR
jgi:stage 0 sporulation regulatory protein